MGTAAEQGTIGVGTAVVQPDGTVATIDASDGTDAECVWFVGHQIQRATHPLAVLRVATPAEVQASVAAWNAADRAAQEARHRDGPASEVPVSAHSADADDAVTDAQNAATTFDLLVGFVNWLGTRDEIVGPFSKIHHPNPSQAPRLVAEYLAAQA